MPVNVDYTSCNDVYMRVIVVYIHVNAIVWPVNGIVSYENVVYRPYNRVVAADNSLARRDNEIVNRSNIIVLSDNALVFSSTTTPRIKNLPASYLLANHQLRMSLVECSMTHVRVSCHPNHSSSVASRNDPYLTLLSVDVVQAFRALSKSLLRL